MITALKIWAVVGGSWVSGILLAKLFCGKKFPFIAFVVVCASIIGLICRYFLEFGEASNTYNFTIPNVLFHLAGMAAITFWGWLNATGQSEKVSWASIGKRKIVAVILVLCLVCAGIYVWSIRFQVMVSSYEYRYGAGNFLSPDGQYKVELIILGKNDENGSFPLQDPVNDRFDICARLWFDPENRSDGAICWYDTNTKYIYFKKDCTDLDVEWVDDDTVIIDGKEIDV